MTAIYRLSAAQYDRYRQHDSIGRCQSRATSNDSNDAPRQVTPSLSSQHDRKTAFISRMVQLPNATIAT
jgi:hypothetical protein